MSTPAATVVTTPSPKPAVVPPATTPEPTPSPAPTNPATEPAKDLKDIIKNPRFWDNVLGKAKPEDAKPAPSTTTPEPAPATPATTEPAAAAPAATAPGASEPVAPPAKPDKKPRKKPELDQGRALEIATTAATKAATEAALRVNPPAPATKPPDADAAFKALVASLPEELQADADTYAEMQQLFPDKYENLLPKLAAYSKAEEEYAAAWSAKHPNDEFDPDAPEHNAFYEKNEPQFSKKDFKAAERSIIHRDTLARINKELRPQLEKLEMDRKTMEIVPEIHKALTSVMGAVLGGINVDYSKLAQTPDELAKLSEKDPIAGETAALVFGHFQPIIHETVKLFAGATGFNPKHPAHVELFHIMSDMESGLSKLPEEDRMDGNNPPRLFATREEYMSLTEAERSKRWTLERDHVVEYIGGRAEADAQSIYKREHEKVERVIKAKGLKPGDPKPPTPPSPPAPQVTPEAPEPAVGAKPVVRNNEPPATPARKNWRDTFGTGISYR